jgi:dipeptidyl aminopeptidase/acylaminoacyl peptidase
MKYAILTYILILLQSLFAQKKPFTLEAQFGLEYPNEAVISPDGRFAAYTIRKPEFDKARWNTQLYMIDIQSKKTLQLTTSQTSISNPKWSIDSKIVLFLSTREFFDAKSNEVKKGTKQLWSIPIDGGEASILFSLPNGIDEYTVSPNGKMIAAISEKELTEEEHKEKAEREKSKNDEVVFPKQNPQKDVWLFNWDSKDLEKIAPLDPGASNFVFSSKSDKLVYQTNYTGEYNDDQNHDLWILYFDGTKEQLTDFAGPETSPAFSPDDLKIAFIAQTVPDIEYAESDIHIIDLKSKNVVNLTRDFKLSIIDFFWHLDGKIIFAQVAEGVQNTIYKINVQTGEARRFVQLGKSFASYTIDSKGSKHCALVEDAHSLKEICLIEKGSIQILTDYSAQLMKYSVSPPEIIRFTSKDKKFTIESILIKPIRFEKNNKYPLILCLHGGPYAVFRQTLIQSYPMQVYANNGYLVLAPNVRGSSGYDDEFGQANKFDLGGGDYLDAMASVDYLISLEFVDTSRMGVIGGSYGGYLTNWIISQTNKFKAAVSMYGIFSFFTDFSNSWQPAFEKMYFGYNYWEKPIDMNNLWVNRSPAFFVKNITTPVLILQGEKDLYTNIANSQEMYQALKTLNRDVEYIVYPREGHGIRNEPQHYINMLGRGLAWFNKYLK